MRKKDPSGEGNTLKVCPPPKALKKYPPPLMTRVEKKLSTQFMKNLHAPLPEGKKLKGLPPYQVVKKLHVPFWPESKKYPVRKKLPGPTSGGGKIHAIFHIKCVPIDQHITNPPCTIQIAAPYQVLWKITQPPPDQGRKKPWTPSDPPGPPGVNSWAYSKNNLIVDLSRN